jgi:hypothetical protein
MTRKGQFMHDRNGYMVRERKVKERRSLAFPESSLQTAPEGIPLFSGGDGRMHGGRNRSDGRPRQA